MASIFCDCSSWAWVSRNSFSVFSSCLFFPFSSRVLSLTLRLFGNVVSIELIVAIIFSLLPAILPSVMAVYGAATGLIQAYIFSVLTASYIGAGVAVNDELAERSLDEEQANL